MNLSAELRRLKCPPERERYICDPLIRFSFSALLRPPPLLDLKSLYQYLLVHDKSHPTETKHSSKAMSFTNSPPLEEFDAMYEIVVPTQERHISLWLSPHFTGAAKE